MTHANLSENEEKKKTQNFIDFRLHKKGAKQRRGDKREKKTERGRGRQNKTLFLCSILFCNTEAKKKTKCKYEKKANQITHIVLYTPISIGR